MHDSILISKFIFELVITVVKNWHNVCCGGCWTRLLEDIKVYRNEPGNDTTPIC